MPCVRALDPVLNGEVFRETDQNARYDDIAKALGASYQSGLGKIGFVTEDAAKD